MHNKHGKAKECNFLVYYILGIYFTNGFAWGYKQCGQVTGMAFNLFRPRDLLLLCKLGAVNEDIMLING